MPSGQRSSGPSRAPVKIAVISNGSRSLLNFRGPLLAEMRRRGYEVIALAPDHDAQSRAALTELGVLPVDYNLTSSGTNPIGELASIVDLRRQLRNHQPDVCFGYFIKPVIYGTIAAWLAGIKCRYGLIAGLGYAFTSAPGRSWRRAIAQDIILTLARFAIGRMHGLMFQNADDMAEFVDRGLVTTRKGTLIGATGVDLADWAVAPLPPTPVTFVLAARLLRDKGVADFVDAARLLRADGIPARFLLLGGLDNNPAAITRDEVEKWVRERLIEWPGHVDVKSWLEQSHVFVLPSYYREGVPRSTQEAMAMGRPVITTDAPGCRDTVVEGENGFLVPVRDPVALAAAMRRFIDAPSIIAPMGRASRKLAEERFDVHVQNRKLLNFMKL